MYKLTNRPKAISFLSLYLVQIRDYPMLFELRNNSAERVSHCGVLEFTSEEGIICMPCWVWMMMENMRLKEGDLVRLKIVSLRRGKYIKLQPHCSDFLDISNPKAIDQTEKFYVFLSTGDTIMVAYNNKKYYINIVETKPSHAVSIIETDCEVDFAPPLDYKEPERPIQHRFMHVMNCDKMYNSYSFALNNLKYMDELRQ
ncbi:hypothetical protein F8388_021196, partial [Cannabis sativa]